MKSIKNILLGCCLLAAPFALDAKLTTAQAERNLTESAAALKGSTDAKRAQRVLADYIAYAGQAALKQKADKILGNNGLTFKKVETMAAAPATAAVVTTHPGIPTPIATVLGAGQNDYIAYRDYLTNNITATDIATMDIPALNQTIASLDTTNGYLMGIINDLAAVPDATAGKAELIANINKLQQSIAYLKNVAQSHVATLSKAPAADLTLEEIKAELDALSPDERAALLKDLGIEPTQNEIAAATAIQKMWRGKKTRNDLKKAEEKAKQAAAARFQEISKEIADMQPLELDQLFKDLGQPAPTAAELAHREQAASKIQAAFRSYQGNKTLKELKAQAKEEVAGSVKIPQVPQVGPVTKGPQIPPVTTGQTGEVKVPVQQPTTPVIPPAPPLPVSLVTQSVVDYYTALNAEVQKVITDAQAATLRTWAQWLTFGGPQDAMNAAQNKIRETLGKITETLAQIKKFKNELGYTTLAQQLKTQLVDVESKLTASKMQLDQQATMVANKLNEVKEVQGFNKKTLAELNAEVSNLFNPDNTLKSPAQKALAEKYYYVVADKLRRSKNNPAEQMALATMNQKLGSVLGLLQPISEPTTGPSTTTIGLPKPPIEPIMRPIPGLSGPAAPVTGSPTGVGLPQPEAPIMKPIPGVTAPKFNIPDFTAGDYKDDARFKDYIVNEVDTLIDNNQKAQAQELERLARARERAMAPGAAQTAVKGALDTLEEWIASN